MVASRARVRVTVRVRVRVSEEHEVTSTGADHACHIRPRLARDLDPKHAPFDAVVGRVGRVGAVGVVGEEVGPPWVGHVLDADGRGGGRGFVEGGRDEEFGHEAVEEDLRHLRSVWS